MRSVSTDGRPVEVTLQSIRGVQATQRRPQDGRRVEDGKSEKNHYSVVLVFGLETREERGIVLDR